MRNAFIKALSHAAHKNKNILVLTGDLGYTVFEQFISENPKALINLGVGEANMMGAAAGLAREGNTVLVYSIIPFVTMRCFEQIRNDVCVHQVNVKIIGVGSGLGYAHLGTSHHEGEDIAIMRSLPNMMVLVPADPIEVEAALACALKHDGPVYIRLGKAGEPNIHKKRIQITKNTGGFTIKSGKKVLILTTGTISPNVLLAAALLEKYSIFPQVVSVPMLKPLARDWLRKIAHDLSYLFTIEEHSIIGGLGSAVAEELLESNIKPKCFKRLGFNDSFCRVIGSYEYMRHYMGLSPNKIADTIHETINQNKI